MIDLFCACSKKTEFLMREYAPAQLLGRPQKGGSKSDLDKDLCELHPAQGLGIDRHDDCAERHEQGTHGRREQESEGR